VRRYEFLPGCFLTVSISSGYFTVILAGSLPPDAPGSVLADNVEQVIGVLDAYFQLTYSQRQSIAEYLSSRDGTLKEWLFDVDNLTMLAAWAGFLLSIFQLLKSRTSIRLFLGCDRDEDRICVSNKRLTM
jgi:hypothetical protein